MNIADKLSLCRVVYAPVFVCLYLFFTAQNNLSGLIVLLITLCLAELTDYFDGFAARKLNQVSDFGKLIDPFCDTILQLSIFFCFAVALKIHFAFFLLLMYREFGMLFTRMLCIKNGVAVAARMGGKIKTVLLITTCFFILIVDIYVLYRHTQDWYLNDGSNMIYFRSALMEKIKFILCVLCVVASYISFIDYLIHFKITIKKNNRNG
ncbi:hypothetical protein FACS1894102_1960 [Spirochaetia bacterium]|nr:hypothetical protein FACS1894102_1960 [Spirochaetia bacterium]